MAAAPPPPAPSLAVRGLPQGSRRWWLPAGGGLLILALVAGVWLATRPAPTPPLAAPQVQSLTYQDLDGAILSVDATSGVTRTLLPRGGFVTRLLDASPDGLSLAYIESTRPTTATVWYAPVTDTVRVRGRGGSSRTVRLTPPGLHPTEATFLDDDTLAVQAGRGRNVLSQLYLYSQDSGTTRLLAGGVSRVFPLPDQNMLLYTHELTGPGVFNPGGSPRVVELAALEVSGSLTPQPVATWALSQEGDPVQVWPVPAHDRIFYTTLNAPPAGGTTVPGNAYPVAIMALPVRPLGSPQRVATFTTEFLGGAVNPRGSGRYLTWVLPRPTPLPGTPAAFRVSTPAPLRLGEVRWAGDQPSLAELPLPEPGQFMIFVAGGDWLTYRTGPVPGFDFGAVTVVPSGGSPVPGRATIAAANRTPTPRPPVAGPVAVLDPATGQRTILSAAFNTVWHSAQGGPQTGEALALDDRLLLIGPDPAGGAVTPGPTPVPQHLLLAQRAGGDWRVTSLGPVGAPTLQNPIEIVFYGLTPDRTALILGRPSEERTLVTPTGADRATLIYRVPLVGGPWTLLGQALPDSPIVPHRPSGEQ
jgi:hypothetical protein